MVYEKAGEGPKEKAIKGFSSKKFIGRGFKRGSARGPENSDQMGDQGRIFSAPEKLSFL